MLNLILCSRIVKCKTDYIVNLYVVIGYIDFSLILEDVLYAYDWGINAIKRFFDTFFIVKECIFYTFS